jgi:Zn finger protein HypA/HybF involved in hydrogenase expression
MSLKGGNALAVICWECDREFAIHRPDKEALKYCPFCHSADLGIVNTTANMEVNR